MFPSCFRTLFLRTGPFFDKSCGFFRGSSIGRFFLLLFYGQAACQGGLLPAFLRRIGVGPREKTPVLSSKVVARSDNSCSFCGQTTGVKKRVFSVPPGPKLTLFCALPRGVFFCMRFYGPRGHFSLFHPPGPKCMQFYVLSYTFRGSPRRFACIFTGCAPPFEKRSFLGIFR